MTNKVDMETSGNGDTQNMLLEEENFDKLLKLTPLTDDTTCGIWWCKGNFLQKFANKKTYVFLYGVSGLFFTATFAYFNGTITTIEKRYKIPSRNTGIISVGNDIAQLFVSAALSYYAGKGHRPRWIAVGLFIISLSCIVFSLPHFIYGPGEDALMLTTQYGAQFNDIMTLDLLTQEQLKTICRINSTNIAECEIEEGNIGPQVILFTAQVIAGIGASLHYAIGVAYMDDNIKKSKTPALISLSYFIRMLGPGFGYTLASLCLKTYISPTLSPTITIQNPKWLGAWWMGWIALAICMIILAFPLGLLPKVLPRAAVRKILEKRQKQNNTEVEQPSSIKDMLQTFKRVLKNKTLMFNNTASIFQFFGSMAYWIFTPKYIEIQYRQSASLSSLVTGTVAIAFSALGIIVSGFVISKYKPRARYLAAWNVFVGFLSVLGMLFYVNLGCTANENTMIVSQPTGNENACNFNCQCDYVRYSPVCGEDGFTYVSACHAGCSEINSNGSKYYDNCLCISPPLSTNTVFDLDTENHKFPSTSLNFLSETTNSIGGGKAVPGSCPVDCFNEFVMFLMVMCVNKFIGATGRASNFLVSVRCVDEKDKTVSMGLGLMLLSLFSFIPSPIFFGTLLDSTCIVWGKTCSGTGNCWLYDGETLRYLLNITAASFVFVGTIFDAGVWYFVKDLKIFDDEKQTEMKEIKSKDDKTNLENI